MKSNLKIKILLMLLIITSCSKIDLQREQYDVIYIDQFYKSEQDAKAALTGLYNDFIIWSLTNSSTNGWVSEIMTDELEIGQWKYSVYSQLQYTKSETRVTAPYGQIVQSISRATTLIANLETCPMNEKLRKQYIAEARGLRVQLALYGYDLYGGVGMVTDPKLLTNINHSDYYPKRLSKAETAKFIEEEVGAIINDLPDKYLKGNIDYGRVTKGMVYTILLKVLMQEHQFAKAEIIARKIVAFGYTLVSTSYADVFTLANEQNNETIWSLGMIADNISLGNTFITNMIPGDLRTQNSKQSANNGWRMVWKYYDEYELTDDRLKVVIGSYINKNGTLVVRGKDQLLNGAIQIKYGEDLTCAGYYSGVDMIMYRYADVVLLLAECINENNNGPTQEAVTLLNMIRTRAKVSTKSITDFPSKQSFNDFLLNERGRELFMENTRHMDLTRMGKYEEMVLKHKGISMAPFRKLAPIPQNVIDQSKGVVVQNPGY